MGGMNNMMGMHMNNPMMMNNQMGMNNMNMKSDLLSHQIYSLANTSSNRQQAMFDKNNKK